MRITLGYTVIVSAVLTLTSISAAASHAQIAPAPTRVVIAVINDYPLFKSSDRNRPPNELGAIVIPRDLVDKEQSMVILNPAYVSAEVLYAALSRLNSISAQESQTKLFGVSRGGIPTASPLPPTVLAALSATIRSLLATQPSKLRGHPYGKHILLTEEMRRMIAGAPLRPTR